MKNPLKNATIGELTDLILECDIHNLKAIKILVDEAIKQKESVPGLKRHGKPTGQGDLNGHEIKALHEGGFDTEPEAADPTDVAAGEPAAKVSLSEILARDGAAEVAKQITDLRQKLSKAEERIEFLKKVNKGQNHLFERLDKAMASPERIEEDTAMVGGFVSNLNLTETAEEIVDRACAIIKS